jgi:hypothetical protein
MAEPQVFFCGCKYNNICEPKQAKGGECPGAMFYACPRGKPSEGKGGCGTFVWLTGPKAGQGKYPEKPAQSTVQTKTPYKYSQPPRFAVTPAHTAEQYIWEQPAQLESEPSSKPPQNMNQEVMETIAFLIEKQAERLERLDRIETILISIEKTITKFLASEKEQKNMEY